jgi:hypothetical protein
MGSAMGHSVNRTIACTVVISALLLLLAARTGWGKAHVRLAPPDQAGTAFLVVVGLLSWWANREPDK